MDYFPRSRPSSGRFDVKVFLPLERLHVTANESVLLGVLPHFIIFHLCNNVRLLVNVYIKKNCIHCFSYPDVRTCPNYRAVTRSPASDNACARACVEAQLNRMRKQCFNQRTT